MVKLLFKVIWTHLLCHQNRVIDCGVLGAQAYVHISYEVNDVLAAVQVQQSTVQRIPSFRKPHLSNCIESVVLLLTVDVSQKLAVQCTIAQI